MNEILIGGGCFWKQQLNMQRVDGVNETEVGYSGGILDYPCYRLICTGQTQHAEVVRVKYDCSTMRILRFFFNQHNPTQLNRQGDDTGTQYRSCIFYNTEGQRIEIEKFISQIQKYYKDPIVTQISQAKKFWPAEEFHQKYLERAGQSAEKNSEDTIKCYG